VQREPDRPMHLRPQAHQPGGARAHPQRRRLRHDPASQRVAGGVARPRRLRVQMCGGSRPLRTAGLARARGLCARAQLRQGRVCCVGL